MARKKQIIPFSGYFPPEILTNVLARLPVKSLLRFRCVCKSWCEIIDNPNFISMHLNCFNTHEFEKYGHVSTLQNEVRVSVSGRVRCIRVESISIAFRNSGTFRRFHLIKIPKPYKPFVGINGLILLVHNSDLRLWNPSIRKSLQLPPYPMLDDYLYHSVLAVGFSASSNVYKVVAFQYVAYSDSKLAFSVYRVGEGCSRTSSTFVDWLGYCLRSDHPVSTNGAAHWLMYRDLENFAGREERLLSFGFNAEEFSLLELPLSDDDILVVRLLFLLDDLVALLGVSFARMYIWVRVNNDGGKERWTKWYSRAISSSEYSIFCPWRGLDGRIFYVKKSGVFLICRDYKVISYNIRSGEICQLAKSALDVRFMYTHVESLVLRKGLGAHTSTLFP